MSFKWYQNTSTVTISFVVPPSVTTKENLDVVITATSIRAGPKGGPAVVEANLNGQVKPPGCSWNIKGNTATIVLDKAAKARWPALFSKGPADSRKRVKVLYDYAAQDTVELTIKEDEIIYVIKEDPSGWWKGELAGKVGLFPSNFVEELPSAKQLQEPPESPEPDLDPNDQGSTAETANPEGTPTPSERGGVPMPGLGGQDALAELKNKLANRKPTAGPSKEPAPKEAAPAPAPTRVALKPTRGPTAPKEAAPPPAASPAPVPARGPPKEAAPAPAPSPAPASNPPPTRGAPPPSRGPAPAAQPGPQPVKVALRPTKKEEPEPSPTSAPAPATKVATRPITKQSTPPPSESQSSEKDDFKKKLEAQQKAALSGSGGARSSVLISVNSAESSSGGSGSFLGLSAQDEGGRKGSVNQKSKPAAKPKEIQPAVPKCQAQYDYDAQADGELSFKEGDIIIIKLRDESGWWQGDLNGQVGWFPANFVEEMPLEAPPAEAEPVVDEETVEEKLQEVVSGSPRLEAVRRASGASGRKPPSLRRNKQSNQNQTKATATPAAATQPAKAATQAAAPAPAPAATPAPTQPKVKVTAPATAPVPASASNGESEVKRPALKSVKKAEPAPAPAKEETPKQPVSLKKTEPAAALKSTQAAPGTSQLRSSRLITSSTGGQPWPVDLGGSFEDFCEELVSMFNDVKSRVKEGSPYQTIPSLSRQDSQWFGFGICSVDGKSYYHGDDVSFTLHGISWPMLYILAAEENGEEKIHTLCGNESGPTYGLNLTSDKKPQNPFVAAGAITLASLIQNKNDELTRLMNVSDRFAAIIGQQQLSSSIPSYLALQLHASQEAMIAYNLKANGVLTMDVDVKRVLDFYFQVCSIQTTVQQAAVGAATLANAGVCPTTNQYVIICCSSQVRKCFDSKLMKKLGSSILNFGANEHSESLGVHAQSGISGAVTVMIPKVMGLCVYAPGVDQTFASTRALEFVKLLLEKYPTIKNFKF